MNHQRAAVIATSRELGRSDSQEGLSVVTTGSAVAISHRDDEAVARRQNEVVRRVHHGVYQPQTLGLTTTVPLVGSAVIVIVDCQSVAVGVVLGSGCTSRPLALVMGAFAAPEFEQASAVGRMFDSG
jgi:hypothetical protein